MCSACILQFIDSRAQIMTSERLGFFVCGLFEEVWQVLTKLETSGHWQFLILGIDFCK